MEKRSARGFTLIELLIVVAIIAILAAIAVPNFLEAQTRAKTARVKSDLRTIATALEAYAVDERHYPPIPMGLGPAFKGFRPLTTPVAYLSTVPRDPFGSLQATGPRRSGDYAYGAMPVVGATRWALASDGPDRLTDIDPIFFYPGYSEKLFYGGMPGYFYTLYDPSNGTISRGDIFRASDYTPAN